MRSRQQHEQAAFVGRQDCGIFFDAWGCVASHRANTRRECDAVIVGVVCGVRRRDVHCR